ncbi:MAG: hypothetical protein FJ197_09930 [Gammaproteobacteria bacterium]|nr:hypothetical protein [Gammaproteobacteria bacterium]
MISTRAAGRPGCRLPLAATLLALLPGLAHGDLEWKVTPVISADLIYEFNPDGVPDESPEPKDDAYISATYAKLNFVGRGQDSLYEIEPSVRFRESWANDSNRQLDGRDYGLRASSAWLLENTRFALYGSYSRLPSRDTDYPIANPNTEQVSGGGLGCTEEIAIQGRCTVDERQDHWYIQPELSRSITPLLAWDANANLSRTSYSEAEITGRLDYDYYAIGSGLTRIFAERHQLYVRGSFSYFNSEQPVSAVEDDERYRFNNRTYNEGIQVGYFYSFSPQLTFSANAGASFSQVRFSGLETLNGLPCLTDNDEDGFDSVPCTLRSDDTNFVGNVILRRQIGDRISAQLNAGREIQPGGDGAQVVSDIFGAHLDREFSTKLRGSVSLLYSSQTALGARTEGVLRRRFDRDYLNAATSINWKFVRDFELQIQFSYQLDKQKSPLDSETTFSLDKDNSVIVLSIRYSKAFLLNGF